MKAIGSRDDARKVEFYIPLSWSPRLSMRRRVTERLYVEKLTKAPGTNAFPWINLYPISNAIASSYSLDSDFRWVSLSNV